MKKLWASILSFFVIVSLILFSYLNAEYSSSIIKTNDYSDVNKSKENSFYDIVSEYINFNITPYNEDELKGILDTINQELIGFDQIEGFQLFLPNLKLIDSILLKTHDLLIKADPNSGIQKVIINFFDKIYHDKLAINYIYAHRVFSGLLEALKITDGNKIQELNDIFREVGTPDFQDLLRYMIRRIQDEQLKYALLRTLGKIGNQKAAFYIYEALRASPKKVYLDILMDLGLPDFNYKEGKSRGTVKNLTRKENPDKNLKKFSRNFERFNQEIEKIFSVLDLSAEEKQKYRRALIQTRGKTKLDGDYSFTYRGITFKEGDIIMSMGSDPVGRFWGVMTNHPVGFSHFTMVTFTNNGFPLIAEIGHHVKFTHLEDALKLFGDFLVLRFKDINTSIRDKINSVINLYYRNRKLTKFDGHFDLKTDYSLYCGEFIYQVYKRAQVPIKWIFSEFPTDSAKKNIAKMGVEQKYLITHGDFLRMPEFSLVGDIYNKALKERISGRILISIYRKNYISKEMDFNNIPEKTKYKIIFKILRSMNARDSKRFNKSIGYTMVTFFMSFDKIYKTGINRAKDEKLTLYKSYDIYQKQMKKIMEEESKIYVESIFRILK